MKTRQIGERAAKILNYLWDIGPTSTPELLALVRPVGASSRWGNSYFALSYYSNGSGASLPLRGLVGRMLPGELKKSNAYTWYITKAGISALKAYNKAYPAAKHIKKLHTVTVIRQVIFCKDIEVELQNNENAEHALEHADVIAAENESVVSVVASQNGWFLDHARSHDALAQRLLVRSAIGNIFIV